jgi:hypothetical protein
VPFDRTCLPLSEKPNNHVQEKLTVQPGDAFEGTALKPGFEIVEL